jgi:hypothetical protein
VLLIPSVLFPFALGGLLGFVVVTSCWLLLVLWVVIK